MREKMIANVIKAIFSTDAEDQTLFVPVGECAGFGSGASADTIEVGRFSDYPPDSLVVRFGSTDDVVFSTEDLRWHDARDLAAALCAWADLVESRAEKERNLG